MDIDELVSRLKSRGDIVRQPVRLRRKPRKANARPRLYEGSAKQKADARAAGERYWSSLRGTYKHLEKTYRSREKRRLARGTKVIRWLLSMEEWKLLWQEAGQVVLPGGAKELAFRLRGKSPEDCKLYRIDENKDWTLDNCVIVYRGNVLANGKKLAKDRELFEKLMF